jgi:hypothetical protein
MTWALEVVPLVGPVSLLLALAASGLNGQNFAFVGYLPQDAAARAQRIRELESLALRTGQTQLFIETPYRNAALLQALLQTLQPTPAGGRQRADTGSPHTSSDVKWLEATKPAPGQQPRRRCLPSGANRLKARKRRSAEGELRMAGRSCSACTAPSPTAAPKRLTSRSATLSRRV